MPAPLLDSTASFLTGEDRVLWNQGKHDRAFSFLGAHLQTQNGVGGTRFAVWAPNALRVSVIGNFNGWAGGRDALACDEATGIWHGWIPNVTAGAL